MLRYAVKLTRDDNGTILVTAPDLPEVSTFGDNPTDALVRAATVCNVRLLTIPEKQLDEHAERALTTSVNSLRTTIASLGKSVGPPWGKDQKDASLAAMIALQGQMK